MTVSWSAPNSSLTRHAGLQPGQPMQRRARIRPVSAKRAVENRERRALAAELFPERPACAVRDCSQRADDIHETLSRARSGGRITDPSIWAPLCRPHHREITDSEPRWAYDQKLLIHSWEAS